MSSSSSSRRRTLQLQQMHAMLEKSKLKPPKSRRRTSLGDSSRIRSSFHHRNQLGKAAQSPTAYAKNRRNITAPRRSPSPRNASSPYVSPNNKTRSLLPQPSSASPIPSTQNNAYYPQAADYELISDERWLYLLSNAQGHNEMDVELLLQDGQSTNKKEIRTRLVGQRLQIRRADQMRTTPPTMSQANDTKSDTAGGRRQRRNSLGVDVEITPQKASSVLKRRRPSVPELMLRPQPRQRRHSTSDADELFAQLQAINVLQKQKRNAQDIELLYSWIENSFTKCTLLQNLPPVFVRKLLQDVLYVSCETNQTVFTEGELSDSFYIMIRGSISIWQLRNNVKNANIKAATENATKQAAHHHSNQQQPHMKSNSQAQATKESQQQSLSSDETKMTAEATTTTTTMMKTSHSIDTKGASSSGAAPGMIEHKEKAKLSGGAQPGQTSLSHESDLSIEALELLKAHEDITSKALKQQQRLRQRGMEPPNVPSEKVNSMHQQILGLLGPGASFGELGLLNSLPRSATIRCETFSEFLVVSKTAFNKLVKVMYNKDLAGNKPTLLRRFELFADMSEGALTRISHIFKRMTWSRNDNLFTKGQKAKQLILLTSGKADVYALVNNALQTADDHNKDFTAASSSGAQSSGGKGASSGGLPSSLEKEKQGHTTQQQSSDMTVVQALEARVWRANALLGNKKTNIISHIGAGHICGAFIDQPLYGSYLYGVRCVTNVEGFVCDAHEFDRRIRTLVDHSLKHKWRLIRAMREQRLRSLWSVYGMQESEKGMLSYEQQSELNTGGAASQNHHNEKKKDLKKERYREVESISNVQKIRSRTEESHAMQQSNHKQYPPAPSFTLDLITCMSTHRHPVNGLPVLAHIPLVYTGHTAMYRRLAQDQARKEQAKHQGELWHRFLPNSDTSSSNYDDERETVPPDGAAVGAEKKTKQPMTGRSHTTTGGERMMVMQHAAAHSRPNKKQRDPESLLTMLVCGNKTTRNLRSDWSSTSRGSRHQPQKPNKPPSSVSVSALSQQQEQQRKKKKGAHVYSAQGTLERLQAHHGILPKQDLKTGVHRTYRHRLASERVRILSSATEMYKQTTSDRQSQPSGRRNRSHSSKYGHHSARMLPSMSSSSSRKSSSVSTGPHSARKRGIYIPNIKYKDVLPTPVLYADDITYRQPTAENVTGL